MNTLIITRWEKAVCTALSDGQKIFQISFSPRQEKAALNNIYIGKVQNIRKNINSAFIDIGNGIIGYYSLTDNPLHLSAAGKVLKELRPGDEIIVQVAREAVKSKALVLTSRISFTGKLAVLTLGKNGIGFSGKISDQTWKTNLKTFLSDLDLTQFGLIIRTNAKDASFPEIREEVDELKARCLTVLNQAAYRKGLSLLYQAPASFLTGVRDVYTQDLEEIVTDDEELYQELQAYLKESQPEDLDKLRWYQDPLLPLKSLYRLNRAVEEATSPRVWLKSGGYLVIEPTEALVVIDVNTGKYAEKKTMSETILKINLEAAREIGRQLRLRNLSGIIIIDFIDMKEEEHRRQLLKELEEVVRRDPIKTTVVEITRLNLVELTRKKLHRPLYEQLAALKKPENLKES